MLIRNRSQNTVLAGKAEKTLSARERMKGLLGRDGLGDDEGLYITPCTSIHSFFMRFVFDAAFLDKQNRVLHCIHRMKPWRLSKLVPSAAGVLELPAGKLDATGTRVGDILEFLENKPIPNRGGQTGDVDLADGV